MSAESIRNMGTNADVLGLRNEAGVLLRDLIHERTGVYFDNGRADLLTDKLSPLVVQRGFSSLLDYYYLLKYDETANEEWQTVLDAIAVPETYFWREMDQVEALVNIVIPSWIKERGAEKLRIWSAACATGEEPLTIAMALTEAGIFEKLPVDIYGSDASFKAIERARSGVYRERAFRNLPANLKQKYFCAAGAGLWRIDETLRKRVRWSIANLQTSAEVAPLATANVIFCRNVFIYFSDEAIQKTLRLFAQFIRRPGYLFVATSESLLRLSTEFVLEEMGKAFVYVKLWGSSTRSQL